MGVISLAHKHHSFDIDGANSRGTTPPTRQAHVIAIAAGTVAFLFSLKFGYAWTGSVTAACIAVVIPISAFRKFWYTARFWIVASLLAAFQIPLVIVAHPLIDEYRFVFMLLFASGDLVVVSVVIYWICS